MKLRKYQFLTALLLPTLFANAHEYQTGQLHIDHPWSMELPSNAPNAAAYFVIHNKGSQEDRLLGADTPMAARAELHEHVHKDDMMTMQQVQSVMIPAGGEVKFEPHGYHVMLFDLKKHSVDGERFPMTLHFQQAGDVDVEVAVQKEAPKDGANHEHE